jgi:O-antigen/teichoic acid export membrane protein
MGACDPVVLREENDRENQGGTEAAAGPARVSQRVREAFQLALRARGLLRFKPFDDTTEEGRSLERYRRIVLTTASGMTARAVGSLLGLVTLPLVLSFLGKERFGLWALITTLMAWVSLFDLGLANGLVNMLSMAHGRDEKEEASRYLSTAFAALLGIAGVLALVALVCIGVVPWSDLFGAKGVVDEGTIRLSVAAALSLFVLSLPFSVTQQIYAAYQRTYIWNGFNLAGGVLGFVLLLVAIHLRVSMPVLILATGVGGFLVVVAAYGYATRRALPWLRPRFGKISREALRGLLSRSVPIFLFQVGALVVNETQSILLAHRCDLATVASYSVAMRVYLLFLAIIQIGTNSFIPALREAHERGDSKWTLIAFARLLRVRVAIAASGGIVIVLFGNLLLTLWLRRSDMNFDRGVWIAMAVLMVVAMWGTSYAELLSIMDRLWLNVGAVLANGAMALTLTYLLSHRYQVFGAILALAIPTSLITVFLRYFGRRFLASNIDPRAGGAGAPAGRRAGPPRTTA